VSRSGVITLTTDFGAADPYAGMMKGVILSIFPAARIVDLSHEIPAHDPAAAAWVLLDSVPFFPPGTVHLAVVDPGVGSKRRPLALRNGDRFFVGPDNGIFSAFLPADETVELNRPQFFLPKISACFHGRDLFAPVAARLAAGSALADFGSPLADPVRLRLPQPVQEGDTLRGEVIRVDRFGNLITNIPERLLPPSPFAARIGGTDVPGLFPCYAAIPAGTCAALLGSSGRLEIARPQGSAAAALAAAAGATVAILKRI